MKHHASKFLHIFLFLIATSMQVRGICSAKADSTGVSTPTTDSIGTRPALGVGVNGGIQLSNVFYHTSLDTGYRSPFSYVLSGQTSINWKNVSLPFSFVFSEQDRSFHQPFNQFGASPRYKWITVHAGYRSLTFSPYTLAGHTFLGGGVELNPGKLRFGIIYGRFIKAVSADSVLLLPGQSAYDRYAFSVKLGVGKPTNYVDFIYLKGWDKPSAILDPNDTTIARPASNTVLGLTINEQLGKKILLKINSAGSIYTNDIYGEALQSDDKIVQKTINAFTVNATTQLHYALDASLGYTAKSFGIGVAYKRISPDYKSMGMYFVTNDIEQYTITPSITLWKRTFRLSGSIGFEHDNLAENRSYQTKRVIGSANLNINPTPAFGITGSFYNYSIGQVAGIRQLNDTIRLAQINNGITISPRLILGKKNLRHMILLTLDMRSLNDQNIYTESYTEYKTNTQFLNYSISQIKEAWTLSLSVNNNSIKSDVLNTNYRGGSAGISKSFFKNKLSTGITAGYNIIKEGDADNGHMINASGNVGYRFFERHQLSLYAYSNNFNSSSPVSPSYNDYTVRIQYQYSFSKKSIL